MRTLGDVKLRKAQALIGVVLCASFIPVAGTAQAVSEDSTATTIVVTGEVLDASTRQPVANALVELVSAQRRVLTDANGGFRFEGVSEGEHQFRASQLGYITLSEMTELLDDDLLTVWLTPKAIDLEGITVTVNRMTRRRRAFPRAVRAMDANEIAMSSALDAADLLERIPGARTVPCGATDCVLRRGRYTPVRIVMDEMLTFGGLSALYGYPTSAIHSMEFIPSCSVVRVYTKQFVERMARVRGALFTDMCQTF